MKHLMRAGVAYIGVSLLLLFFALPAAYAAYGEAPTFAGSSTNPPVCGWPAPKTVWPFSARALANGNVELTWGKMENVSSWTVAYGFASGTYIYGQSHFGNGDWNNLVITDLPAGTYYFVIRGNNRCMPGPFSSEWKVVVGGGSGTFIGGQQLGAEVEAAAPEEAAPQQLIPPGGTGYTPPEDDSTQPGVPLPEETAFTPGEPVSPPWWQGIVDFFSGLFGNK